MSRYPPRISLIAVAVVSYWRYYLYILKVELLMVFQGKAPFLWYLGIYADSANSGFTILSQVRTGRYKKMNVARAGIYGAVMTAMCMANAAHAGGQVTAAHVLRVQISKPMGQFAFIQTD